MRLPVGETNHVPSTDSQLAVQWHPDVHKTWGAEQLHFVRLGFAPIYQRPRIRAALLDVFAEHNIRSYVAYELLASTT